MSWKEDLQAYAGLHGWPDARVLAAHAAIAALPHADDWLPPASFWSAAAAVARSQLSGLSYASELAQDWSDKAALGDQSWTDVLVDGAKDGITDVVLGPLAGLKTAADNLEIGTGNAAPSSQDATSSEVMKTIRDVADATKKGASAAQWAGLGLVALGAAYFLRSR